MAGKNSWLEAGLKILGAAGPTGLTLDKLVAETGLSTGSFYHHFAGMDGYKRALLAHFEEVYTSRYIREVDAADTGVSARERVDLLTELVLADDHTADLELAIRAWALDEPLAAAAKERVDGQRLAFLRSLLAASGRTPRAAADLADLLYLTLLGAGHVLPTVPPERVRELFEAILRE